MGAAVSRLSRLRPRDPIDSRGVVMARSDMSKVVLDETELPSAWYNILPDLPGDPAPPLHPGTMQPVGPEDLAPLFPEAIIMQEVSGERGPEERPTGRREHDRLSW